MWPWKINDLIRQPNSALLQDPEIANAVHGYLGDGYVPYQRAGNLLALIQKGPIENGQYESTKNIMFILQKNKLEKLIRYLNETTATLRRIREASVAKADISVQPTSRTISRLASSLHTIRIYASTSYSAVSAGYMVSCHPQHETGSFLHSRPALLERKKHVGLKNASVAFTVEFAPSEVVINFPTERLDPPMKLGDLCLSITQARDHKIFLDIYLSRSGRLYANNEKGNTISLKQVLQSMGQRDQSSHIQWTLNQRLALSFNIASDKSLMHRGGDQHMDMPQPFIRQTSDYGAKDSAPGVYNPKRSMLELGIRLLELWHPKTFETYAAEGGWDVQSDFGSRYDVARYLEVVTRCVECTFAISCATPTWGDIAFRKSVCEYILKPLLENCPSNS
ncbi:uncharacterized protein BDW43DRAFT_298381 [Aspergillus alliaceus]|uniref:uncharacterized protein n=1 Tax=Petromyces alliaceus TaxID=209559 RepID=UPI0012A55322|nr:uncharacterized protein BDW43DRAFT_298381 [Aspergillus alliaceus]KAB8236295.1 hypothetical protein BDW43DRAFT_298381 [Aspergillus alliaceus]